MAIGNMMTAKEAAERLNVSKRRVLQFLEEGRLPGQKAANLWFFKRADVDRFANKTRQTGRPKKTSNGR